MGCEALKAFTVVRGYLDGDFDHVDQYTVLCNCLLTVLNFVVCLLLSTYTWHEAHLSIILICLLQALGNMYFIHKSLTNVKLFDYTSRSNFLITQSKSCLSQPGHI